MDYNHHLLKLIKKRNAKELMFKDIINDYNDIYKHTKHLKQENATLQKNNELLTSKIHSLEEMTKITIHKTDIIINDDYF